MRIAGGFLKGRRLISPAGSKVRPTTDKLRSAVFSILNGKTENARVLDAFAGSGALGIEAYSRGASTIAFVDKDLSGVKSNLSLIERGDYYIKRGDFFSVAFDLRQSFDVIFIDPPYGAYEPLSVLLCVKKAELLAPGGMIVYEEFFKTPFPADCGFEIKIRRKYGDTVVVFLEGDK